MFLWEFVSRVRKVEPGLGQNIYAALWQAYYQALDAYMANNGGYKDQLYNRLRERFGQLLVVDRYGADWFQRWELIVYLPDSTKLREVLEYLRNHEGFDYLNFITAYDCMLQGVLAVVYHVSRAQVVKDRIRLRLRFLPMQLKQAIEKLPEHERQQLVVDDQLELDMQISPRVNLVVLVDRENPVLPSCMDLWPGADWHEREAYDMFGIEFTNRPLDRPLVRILMPENWQGFPLRKDFFH